SVLLLQTQAILGEIDRMESLQTDQLTTAELARTRYAARTKVYFFRSSSLAHALYFGNGNADFAFSRELYQLYPDNYFYNVWARAFCAYSRPVPLTLITAHDPQFLLQGTTYARRNWLPFPVERVYTGKVESLFRLKVSPLLQQRTAP